MWLVAYGLWEPASSYEAQMAGRARVAPAPLDGHGSLSDKSLRLAKTLGAFMKNALKPFVLLLLAGFCSPACPVLAAAAPPEAKVNISGTLNGHNSRAPLAKAWVGLAKVTRDQEGRDTAVTLTEFSAMTDEKGYFQFKGVPAGIYTVIYKPGPATPSRAGTTIPVRKLSMVIKSFMPMMRDKEVGREVPLEERQWSPEFTLLKGHTLYCLPMSPHMKIWNASVRNGRQGPYLEVRKNQIWAQEIVKDTQLKVEAWGL